MLEAGTPRWQRYLAREAGFAYPRTLSAGKTALVQLLPSSAMLARHLDPSVRLASTKCTDSQAVHNKSGQSTD
mgnify:FL=1